MVSEARQCVAVELGCPCMQQDPFLGFVMNDKGEVADGWVW